jgi:hypothetical protein
MLSLSRYLALAVVLCGCERPAIQSMRVSALEDQPKIISADIRTSGNMGVPHVAFAAVAPTGGAVPDVDMRLKNNSGAIPVFEGAAPLTADFAALAYGTKWQATVVVPYKILWHSTSMTQTTDFVVGAAKRCSSFDGELERQGWAQAAELRPVPARQPTVVRSTPLNWLANENARPSAITGAIGVTINNIPSLVGSESWNVSLPTGSAYAILRHGSGVQVAIKTSHRIQLHLGVLANRGLRNARPGSEPVFEWVYSNDKEVQAGQWRVIDLPFPELPSAVSTISAVTIADITLTAVNVKNGMQIIIDDVCPLP